MREIKFRAWDGEDEKMLAGESIYEFDGDDGGVSMGGKYLSSYAYLEGKLILMQYTGLKDKNGVEIYEGDIVRHYHKEDRSFFTRQIEYSGHGFRLSRLASFLQNDVDWGEQLEVVGNIYENPELLERL